MNWVYKFEFNKNFAKYYLQSLLKSVDLSSQMITLLKS